MCTLPKVFLGSRPIKSKSLPEATALRNYFILNDNRSQDRRAQSAPVVDSGVPDGRRRSPNARSPLPGISWTCSAASDSPVSKQGVRLSGEPRPRSRRPRRGEGENAIASILKLTDEYIKLIEHFLPKVRGVERVHLKETLNGILHVLQTGRRWVDMPSQYGNHRTA